MSIESGIPSNPLILWPSPLLLLPSVIPSIRVISNESSLCFGWQKYWRFNFSISPSNEYSELISFRLDWWDLHAVQVTLRSLLQHSCWKASILQCSDFFMAQLSHPYMIITKTISLMRWTFFANVKWKWKFLSSVQLFANPWTVAHEILQARILEWVAITFFIGSSQPRVRILVSHIADGFFTSWATRKDSK